MSLVQRMLYAIRALTEDDSHSSRKKQHRRRNRNSRHQQAVALVITFRDLFGSGGLNYLLEDADRRSSAKRNAGGHEPCKAIAIAPSAGLLEAPKLDFTSDLTLPANLKLAPAEAWYVDVPRSDAVPLLHEERIISTSEAALLNASISSLCPPTGDEVVVHRTREWSGKKVVVPLAADDENKTVAALRKVLKWSPRKQSAAAFALEVPTGEKQKAVAVVENAVNRIKEEQQQKKKKHRVFKFTFC